jgi:Cu2+-exporting ATPase
VTAATLTLDDATRAADITCAHCGRDTPGGARFCCTGCEAAFRLIGELGLDAYYDRRRMMGATGRPAADAEAIAVTPFVRQEPGLCRLDLLVDGLECGACAWLIEAALAREPALAHARVNLSQRRLGLSWRGAPELGERLAGRVRALGYAVAPFDVERLSATVDAEERALLRALAVAGFAAANVMLLSVSVWSGAVGEMGPATRDLLHWVSALIALPAIVYAIRPFARSAFAALAAGRTNMDVPITIGVTLAAGMSLFDTWRSESHAYFDSAVTLLFFLLVGRYLDRRARGRARSAVAHVAALSARSATVIDAEGHASVMRPSEVAAGAIVLVAAGERIPVDGRLVEGETDLDTALVTGESLPRPARVGDTVHAGMVNLTRAVRVAAERTGEATLIAEIGRLLEAAESGRSRFVALADRVARAYAPVVHLTALATFLGWVFLADAPWHPALAAAVAVLIITCPCALALAVPAVQVVASGRLFRQGMLVKSPTALERLAEARTIVFDKTGTLTVGRPELLDCVPAAALALAAGMAQASRHPLSRALVRAAPWAPALPEVTEHPGEGLSWGAVRLGSARFVGAESRTDGWQGPELWLSQPGELPLRFRFDDPARADAAETLARLAARGYRLVLISGDRREAVARQAEALGISDWLAESGPGAKARIVEGLAAGGPVVMVGDGINDAPALARASASIAPATAADISRAAADVVFQGDRLAPVAEILEVARASQRLVRQNLGLALVYNLLAVPLAVLGFVTPLVAAVAMSSSSLLVVGNALRLGGRR